MKRIFISYSHADKVWKDRLVKHLRVLEREGFCHLWHDRKIGLGNDWDPEIENALNKADVAVLVISPDFLDSDFTREKEIPRIRERRETDWAASAKPKYANAFSWTTTTNSPLPAGSIASLPLSNP